jgi:hypothetical protein
MNDQQWSHNEGRTHVKDEKNLAEVRLPGRDYFLVVLCVDESRYRVSFTLLDDSLLDLR